MNDENKQSEMKMVVADKTREGPYQWWLHKQSASILFCSLLLSLLNYKCELDLKKVSKKIMRKTGPKKKVRERDSVWELRKGMERARKLQCNLMANHTNCFFNFFGPKAYEVSKTPSQAVSNEVLLLTQWVSNHVTNQTKPPLLSSSLHYTSMKRE